MTPRARRDLVCEEIGGELVIYDQSCHEIHRLNQTAALVWRRCDGERTVDDLAAALEVDLGAGTGRLAALALHDLRTAGLLDVDGSEVGAMALSRREMLSRLKVATYLLPIVATIVAPTALQAQSRGNPNSPTPTTTTTSSTPATTTSTTPGTTSSTTPSTAPSTTTTTTPSPSTTTTTTIPPSSTSTYTCTATRTAQSGNCSFQSSFPCQVRRTRTGNNLLMQVIESATRSYEGTIDSDGNFTCSGTNSFFGCVSGPGSSCSGRFVGQNITCTEHLVLSGCCSGVVDFGISGSCTTNCN